MSESLMRKAAEFAAQQTIKQGSRVTLAEGESLCEAVFELLVATRNEALEEAADRASRQTWACNEKLNVSIANGIRRLKNIDPKKQD